MGTATQRSFASGEPDLPRQFDRYELIARLPGAGMSEVYRARTQIGKTVIIKILPPQEDQPDAQVRFLEEAKIAASLSHENIVSVYDYGEFAGLPFIVMEFLDGETLESVIAKGGIAGDRRALEIGLQIARALEFVHENNVVHRDIKPGNIFVTKSGVVKLIDFGIAKGSEPMLKTQAGIALGTIFYMAPEQVEGQKTPSVDIWAFGLILFEMLTGKRAIDGDSVVAVLHKIRNEPVNLEPLRSCNAPRQVFDLIQRCVAREPLARPQCFTQIAVEIEQLLQGLRRLPPETDPDPLPLSPLTGASQGRMIATVVIAILTFSAVAFAVLRHFQSPPIVIVTDDPGPSVHSSPQPPQRIPFPSGDLLRVPEGNFLFGQEAKPTYLPAFYIDETEVTERAYRDFGPLQGHADPNPGAAENLPVTGITFEQARDFCASAGKRLPSAEEWEKAARGVDGRQYPWGNQEDSTLANVAVGKPRGLQSVGSVPAGRSPYGALDMAGNVWEFVDARRPPTDAEARAFRLNHPEVAISNVPWVLVYGSSYKKTIGAAKVNDPAAVPPNLKSDDVGFRCARNASPFTTQN